MFCDAFRLVYNKGKGRGAVNNSRRMRRVNLLVRTLKQYKSPGESTDPHPGYFYFFAVNTEVYF